VVVFLVGTGTLQKAYQPREMEVPSHERTAARFPNLVVRRVHDAFLPAEYLFWLKNDPDDAVRRHLIAVRWKDWRLYKKHEKDRWQLLDLKSDPREERDLAATHPDIVKRMAAQHAAWATTLAPLGEIPTLRDGAPLVPTGHGWEYASAKGKTN
jgi:arylsulfatase A-like enzyme